MDSHDGDDYHGAVEEIKHFPRSSRPTALLLHTTGMTPSSLIVPLVDHMEKEEEFASTPDYEHKKASCSMNYVQ